MYRVIIKRDGAFDERMETRKMSSGEVYKTVLSAIKGGAHMEKLSGYDRSVRYDAYVYKDGKFLYLLGLTDYRYLSKKWIGLTRACDMKTCVMHV